MSAEWMSASLEWLGSPLNVGALFALFAHFLVLSLLSIGGVMSTSADMHRFVVGEHQWITDAQFTASIALGQAAPGPNVLFVAVIGWNVAGALGAFAAMSGILLPSTTLAIWASRWGRSNRDAIGVRAFMLGFAPVTIGLMLSAGWVLSEPASGHPGSITLIALTVLVMMRTRASPVLLMAVGAIAGALGFA